MFKCVFGVEPSQWRIQGFPEEGTNPGGDANSAFIDFGQIVCNFSLVIVVDKTFL